jgi:hypothetical protein
MNPGDQPMRGRLCPTHFLGKIFSFALLGFLAILLVGPVIAVLSVFLSIVLAMLSFAIAALGILLPFAVLGFLVWAPLHALFSGRPVQWRTLGRMCKGILDIVLSIPRRAWSMMTGSGKAAQEKITGLSSHIGVVLFETFCGALVGFMLGVMAGNMSAAPDIGEVIGIGVLIGAILGALVGTSRIQVKEPQSAEGLN